MFKILLLKKVHNILIPVALSLFWNDGKSLSVDTKKYDRVLACCEHLGLAGPFHGKIFPQQTETELCQ